MIPDTANRAALPALTLLLYGVRSPINLGMILRVAETYGVDVATMDGGDLVTEEGKRRTVSDFACGALQRKGFTEPSSMPELSAGGSRRLIATSIEDGASSLPDFQFVRGDVVVLGNEYDGLPVDVFDACTLRIKIPMADVWTPKHSFALPASHSSI